MLNFRPLPLYVCANHSEHRMKVGSVASVWVAERSDVCAVSVGSKGRQKSCLLKYWVCDVWELYGTLLKVAKFH